jgi:hypothetical protein
MVFIIHTLNRKLLAGNIVEEVSSDSPPSTVYGSTVQESGVVCLTTSRSRFYSSYGTDWKMSEVPLKLSHIWYHPFIEVNKPAISTS